jgi:hypothetical protein
VYDAEPLQPVPLAASPQAAVQMMLMTEWTLI